jgi:hypothetical protein
MGKVKDKYRARVRRVGSETAKLRGVAARELYQGLQDATQVQLYDVSRGKVTRRMYHSIGVQMDGYQGVRVLYRGGVAPYASIRLNRKGTARGGWRLDMNPGEYLNRRVRPKIYAAGRVAQTRILGD